MAIQHRQTLEDDGFRSGMAGALVLHAVLAASLVASAIFLKSNHDRWGENADVTGAIQASMVSALPFPPRTPPVKDQVLASEHESPAPPPPPKEATAPPPKPTDVLIKAPTKTPPPPKVAPRESPAPPPKTPVKPQPKDVTPNEAKRPQPVPETPKATSGETAATQLPSSITQTRNGTATASVQDRTFGNRYAYYLRIVSQKVSQAWPSNEADPASSTGKHAVILFTINRDGIPEDIQVKTPSGSASLDTSAKRAVERVDNGFGPLPSGDHLQILFTFEYKAQ